MRKPIRIWVAGKASSLWGAIKRGYSSRWTGFKNKKLWHWLNLLIIPLVIAFGALLIQDANERVQTQNALDNQRQDALMTYIDQMETLLLSQELRESDSGSEVRVTARARTLSVLRHMDDIRKRYVLQFLYESGLITTKNSILSLQGADLRHAYLRGAELESANLSGAILHEANLERANLESANLEEAYLYEANLERANLESANLEEAYLVSANLERANLESANLEEANLYEANLSRTTLVSANLEGAILYKANFYMAVLSRANLERARFQWANLEGARLYEANLRSATINPEQLALAGELANAIMPDGTKYEEWVK